MKAKETRVTTIATPTPTSEIYQFAINNRLSHSDQLTIAIEIIQTVRNSKTNKTNEKIVEAQRN